jgi:hypothetical protein
MAKYILLAQVQGHIIGILHQSMIPQKHLLENGDEA